MRLSAPLLISMTALAVAGAFRAEEAPYECRTALAKLSRIPRSTAYSYELRAPNGEILLLPYDLESGDRVLFDTLNALFDRGDGPVHGTFTFCPKGVVSHTYVGKPILFGTITAFTPKATK